MAKENPMAIPGGGGARVVKVPSAPKRSYNPPAKQAIPSQIKTATKKYDIKQTKTGKIKVTDTKTGLTFNFPKDKNFTIQNIKTAQAQHLLNKMK